jgi:hypothetical protein
LNELVRLLHLSKTVVAKTIQLFPNSKLECLPPKNFFSHLHVMKGTITIHKKSFKKLLKISLL